MWVDITYPFPNFNGCTIEVWEWINNFISHITGHVITYPCWDLSLSLLLKLAQMEMSWEVMKLRTMFAICSLLCLKWRTVQCHYNVVNLIESPHIRHAHSSPMRVRYRVSCMSTNFDPPNARLLRICMLYRVTLDLVITAPDCISITMLLIQICEYTDVTLSIALCANSDV